MTNVVSVRFRNGAKTYFFDPRQLQIEAGQDVIVETAQGLEYAACVEGNHPVEDHQVVEPFRAVVRIATESDRRTIQRNRTREKEAFQICQKKIQQHGLEMKLVRVECSFEGNKILFFFTADGRVDFRELVKDLASVFHARIELRQIGVRDEAKMLGGLGICGRPFCCAQFLDDFMPVSIKMAKTQSLSLNPTKISGTCGRLMCCLKYEQEAYEDALRRMPKNDSFVQTPDGPGNVSDLNVLKEKVTVRLDSQPESPRCYHNCEVCVLRNGKGSREGIEIPQERPARYVEERTEEEFRPIVSDFGWREEPVAKSAPEREKRSEGEGRRRRGRGTRRPEGGQKAPEQDRQPAQDKQAPRPGEGRRRNRGGRPGGAGPRPENAGERKPQPSRQPAPQPDGGEQKARRPRRRGGRRHGGGKPGGAQGGPTGGEA